MVWRSPLGLVFGGGVAFKLGPHVSIKGEVLRGDFGDLDGKYRCPKGDAAGLNLLSEIFFRPGPSEIQQSTQFDGDRRGLLRPERRLIVSRKVYEVVAAYRLMGWGFEIAHAR